MALSDKAIIGISRAISDDAIKFIHEDERYADFMIEMLTEFVADKLKTQDNELICELACCVMDNIFFTKGSR
jgi:hypothetical protein